MAKLINCGSTMKIKENKYEKLEEELDKLFHQEAVKYTCYNDKINLMMVILQTRPFKQGLHMLYHLINQKKYEKSLTDQISDQLRAIITDATTEYIRKVKHADAIEKIITSEIIDLAVLSKQIDAFFNYEFEANSMDNLLAEWIARIIQPQIDIENSNIFGTIYSSTIRSGIQNVFIAFLSEAVKECQWPTDGICTAQVYNDIMSKIYIPIFNGIECYLNYIASEAGFLHTRPFNLNVKSIQMLKSVETHDIETKISGFEPLRKTMIIDCTSSGLSIRLEVAENNETILLFTMEELQSMCTIATLQKNPYQQLIVEKFISFTTDAIAMFTDFLFT